MSSRLQTLAQVRGEGTPAYTEFVRERALAARTKLELRNVGRLVENCAREDREALSKLILRRSFPTLFKTGEPELP